MYHLVKHAGLDMDLYKGDIVDGKRDGFGTQIFPNGYKYTGEWKKNCAHGNGKLEYTDGTFYEGEFNKNRIQQGVLSYHNGTCFAGKFALDERNKDKFAEGTIVFRNGDTFKGVWHEGIPTSGIYINKHGVMKDYIKGQDFFDYDDKEGGYGKQILANTEDIYEGGFKEGRQEGHGFILSSYPHYESFHNLNGKLNGKYICNYISGGYCYEGVYESGKRVGKWKYQTVKGFFFEGDPTFKKGTVTFPFLNEDYFIGEVEIKFHSITFKNGVYNYKSIDGKYSQIQIKDFKTIDNSDIKVSKVFKFEQVLAKLEHSKLVPEKPVLNGEHTYHYSDGSVFKGNFVYDFIYVHKDDLPRCYKPAVHSNSNAVFNSTIEDVYTFSSTNLNSVKEKKFKGALIEGLKDGYCEIEYNDGTIFKGNFEHDIKVGNGVYTNGNGDTIIGDYIEGKLNGPIAIRRPNNDEITTTAKDGHICEDNVVIKKSNGLLYKGQMHNFVKHGFGTLTYTNGYSLVSHFVNSEIDTSNEPAVLTDPEGNRSKCTFTKIEGRRVGILEGIDDGMVYVYNTSKGSLHKAQ